MPSPEFDQEIFQWLFNRVPKSTYQNGPPLTDEGQNRRTWWLRDKAIPDALLRLRQNIRRVHAPSVITAIKIILDRLPAWEKNHFYSKELVEAGLLAACPAVGKTYQNKVVLLFEGLEAEAESLEKPRIVKVSLAKIEGYDKSGIRVAKAEICRFNSQARLVQYYSSEASSHYIANGQRVILPLDLFEKQHAADIREYLSRPPAEKLADQPSQRLPFSPRRGLA